MGPRNRNLDIPLSILFLFALRGVLGADSTAIAGDGAFASDGAFAGDGALTTASPDDLATVTIFDTPGYSVAVGCVKECLMQEFQQGEPDGLILAAALGCTR